MKNLILLYTLFLSLFLASCTTELDEPIVSTEANTNIQIELPDLEDIKTRALSDGHSINNLKCYVYDRTKAANSAPVTVEDIPLHNYSGKIGAYYSLYLPNTTSYDLVLIATSCPQNDTSKKIYYNQTARTLNLNYDDISPNDEGLDCFWGVITNVSPETSKSYKVTLKRPFAQLNIGTKDLADYNSMASSSLQSVAVNINGAYSSMNVMDGKVSGKTNLTFPAASVISGQTYPVSGNDYLSMNYLLVNERTEVDVKMTVRNQTKSFDCDFTSIPLQRNYQTNIYGNLLTTSNDYNVEIVPDYDGREDKEIDKYAGYDLVLKLTDNFAENGGEISLFYNVPDSLSKEVYLEVDLSKYIDSDNIVKVSWEEIGILNANSIIFDRLAFLPESQQYIKEFLKFDISKLNLKSFSGMFAHCCYLENFDFLENWDTSQIENMAYMFNNCNSAKSINISNFDTSRVTDMHNMFQRCHNLTSLDLSNFDTSKVTDMSHMFNMCEELISLDLSNFDTSKVTDMSNMFNMCEELISLDLSNFDTSKVTDMSNMFDECYMLTSLDVSNFDTSKVTDMSFMFDGCSVLTSLDVSNFDTSKVTDMSHMFQRCHNLTSLDVSNFDTSKVTDMSHMFDECSSLTDLYLNFDFSNQVESSKYKFSIFCDCPQLTNIHGHLFNIPNSFCIHNCHSLSNDTFTQFIEDLKDVSSTHYRYNIYLDYPLYGLYKDAIEAKGWSVRPGGSDHEIH